MTQRPRRALVLCGGGATGAAYEVGVLAALEASLPGFRIQHFDVFVGTSAGALIATLMASGVSAARMYHALTTQDDFFPLRRADVYGFDPREAAQTLGKIVSVATSLASRMRAAPVSTWESLDFSDLSRTLPDGLFTLNRYQRFIERFLDRNQLARSFDGVAPHLLIPANNLDTAHREVFGRGYRLDASLAEAIVASSAIPLFFAPVRIGQSDLIDGGSGKVAHVDLAVAAGATHVLVVNPIVPWNLARRLSEDRRLRGRVAPGTVTRIRERGMWGIWNQAFRVSTVSRLYLGLHRFRAEHPNIGIALMSPSEEDETLFVTSPMSTDARALVARHAFETTRARMRAGGDAIAAVCQGDPDAWRIDGIRQPEVADTSWREI
jgi:NTE family protein